MIIPQADDKDGKGGGVIHADDWTGAKKWLETGQGRKDNERLQLHLSDLLTTNCILRLKPLETERDQRIFYKCRGGKLENYVSPGFYVADPVKERYF